MGKTDIIKALEGLQDEFPWLERVEVDLRNDSEGELAVFVRLLVRSGVEDLFSDGARIMGARRRVHAVLEARGLELWPYIAFVSADEVEAA